MIRRACIYLSDAGQSNQVREDADDSDEGFLVLAEVFWPLVRHGRNEALNGAELWEGTRL